MVFKQGQTLLGQRHECVMDRNEIFQKIFEGKRFSKKHMFSSLKCYTPSGFPRTMPHTTENVEYYNHELRKRQMKKVAYANKLTTLRH